MPGIIFLFGLPLCIGRHEHFPIHMRTHLIENLKQPVIQSDDHTYPLKNAYQVCAHCVITTTPVSILRVLSSITKSEHWQASRDPR
ncbi:hypothetical protein CKF46_35595, partial [Klebsiella pneumoniae]